MCKYYFNITHMNNVDDLFDHVNFLTSWMDSHVMCINLHIHTCTCSSILACTIPPTVYIINSPPTHTHTHSSTLDVWLRLCTQHSVRHSPSQSNRSTLQTVLTTSQIWLQSGLQVKIVFINIKSSKCSALVNFYIMLWMCSFVPRSLSVLQCCMLKSEAVWHAIYIHRRTGSSLGTKVHVHICLGFFLKNFVLEGNM